MGFVVGADERLMTGAVKGGRRKSRSGWLLGYISIRSRERKAKQRSNMEEWKRQRYPVDRRKSGMRAFIGH